MKPVSILMLLTLSPYCLAATNNDGGDLFGDDYTGQYLDFALDEWPDSVVQDSSTLSVNAQNFYKWHPSLDVFKYLLFLRTSLFDMSFILDGRLSNMDPVWTWLADPKFHVRFFIDVSKMTVEQMSSINAELIIY